MLNKNQHQEVDAGGAAYQAGGSITIYQGKTTEDIREIARSTSLEVFNENFLRMTEPARIIAKQRAEEVTQQFLEKLQKENPDGFQKFTNPGFLDAIYTAQKEYAKTGSKSLGDLLVGLLVDQSKQEDRTIMQIVLNESLRTAPKLTDDQLNALSLVFIFTYTKWNGIRSLEDFGANLDKFIKPIHNSIKLSRSSFQHLEFLGCGIAQELIEVKLDKQLLETYPALFSSGIQIDEQSYPGFNPKLYPNLLDNCPRINGNFKTHFDAITELQSTMARLSVPENDRSFITRVFLGRRPISEHSLKKECSELRPYMVDVFNAWETTQLKMLKLSSVGMAIGHANLKRYTGELADLAIWIN